MKVNADCQQTAPALERDTWRDHLRLLFLRGLAGAARPLVSGPRLLDDAPRILVIRPDHLGDLLLSTPALHALRDAVPGAHITALVGLWGRDILARNPHVDEVLTCTFPWFDRQPRTSPLAPYRLLWQQARDLRGRGFDAALNLRPDFWWGAALAYLARIPVRVGYDLPMCRPFLTTRLPLAGAHHDAAHDVAHDVGRNLALVAALTGASVDSDPARWPLAYAPTDEERVWAAAALPGPDWVAVSPGAGGRCKQWTADGWAQVIDALVERRGGRVALVGGQADVELCAAIAAQTHEPPLALAGQTTLGQLAALFGRCRLVLGADSGPLNLAVARAVPTVHLFGPADVAQFRPWGPAERHAVVQADLPCVPCRKLDWPIAPDEVTPCLAAIAPDDVLAAIDRVWGV
ncbi:MAG: glycosyltransferase family 9 protein [Chloroflexi bacterium]|nr:glycosyltransferase family 9 protein [Chloroflexota bacterium]MBU1749076.1 glycosyltransferase family 9 protein [Chloroflexota bacterium]